MGKIAKIFGGGKQDDSALKAQEAKLAKQEAKLEAEEKENALKKNATLKSKRGRQGTQSLLSGLETGVSDDKRQSLG